jgi:hypothetical protein
MRRVLSANSEDESKQPYSGYRQREQQLEDESKQLYGGYRHRQRQLEDELKQLYSANGKTNAKSA